METLRKDFKMAETKNVTKQEPKNDVVKEQKPKVEKKQNGIIVNCACTPLRTEADPDAKAKWYLNENCDIPLAVRQTAYMILTREGMDPKMVRYCDLRKMIFELADSYGLIKISKGLRESFSRESALVSAK